MPPKKNGKNEHAGREPDKAASHSQRLNATSLSEEGKASSVGLPGKLPKPAHVAAAPKVTITRTFPQPAGDPRTRNHIQDRAQIHLPASSPKEISHRQVHSHQQRSGAAANRGPGMTAGNVQQGGSREVLHGQGHGAPQFQGHHIPRQTQAAANRGPGPNKMKNAQFNSGSAYAHGQGGSYHAQRKGVSQGHPSSESHYISRQHQAAANQGRDLFGGNPSNHNVKAAHGLREPPLEGPRPPASSAAASRNVNEYWMLIQHAVASKRPFLIRPDERGLWIEVWTAAAANARGSVEALLFAYLSLPLNVANDLPAHIAVPVLRRIVSDLGSRDYSGTAPSSIANCFSGTRILESVADAIRDRLSFSVSNSSIPDPLSLAVQVEEVSVAFQRMVKSILGANKSSDESLDDRLAVLLSRKIEFIRYKDAIEQQVGKVSMHVALNNASSSFSRPWRGWQNRPTVDWLLSGSWHKSEGLLNAYASSDEYADKLLSVWVRLTFFWGSGAVWPRCRCRPNGNPGGKDLSNSEMVCGEPMLMGTSHGTCSARKGALGLPCGQAASWKCFKNNHDSICGSCLIKQQGYLVGSPGPSASTDIYDGTVTRESTRREGSVYYISNLESRKPPKIAPNWKTTYRLVTPALVAVVRLSVSSEALTRAHILEWGEVVPIDYKPGPQALPENIHRSNGKLALRLLNKGDCPGMLGEVDTQLEVGARVAIIDLRVFVPEVISVLSTFANDSFRGHLAQIPFVQQFIGVGSSYIPVPITLESKLVAIVRLALERSEIEFVRRLSLDAKHRLASRITELKPLHSLYGTQLDAFASAIQCSLHCTQGPPGTGKSYLGVCLALALDVIRQQAEREGSAVGPILILSYKNHALDEFLFDVKEGHALSGAQFRPGMMIRCGKPEQEAMLQFAERRSPLESQKQAVLLIRLDNQRKAKKISKDWADLSRRLAMTANNHPENQVKAWQPHHNSDGLDIRADYDHQVGAVCNALCLLGKVDRDIQDSNRDISDHFDIPAATAFKIVSSTFASIVQDPLISLYLELIRPALDVNLQHWHFGPDKDRGVCLIQYWLQGDNPPHRCPASLHDGSQCLEVSLDDGLYCTRFHSCSSVRAICRNQRSTASAHILFCDEHTCQHELCFQERLNFSPFCESHSCLGCVASGINPVSDNNPNACSLHCCQITGCQKRQVNLHPFCEDHGCIACFQLGAFHLLPMMHTGTRFCKVHCCTLTNCVNMLFSPHATVCREHLCMPCLGRMGKLVPVDEYYPKSLLCTDHRCLHPTEQCVNERIANSAFCRQHTCRICAISSSNGAYLSETVQEDFPRNTCASHPLCNFVSKRGNVCNHEVDQLSGFFCSGHATMLAEKEQIDGLKDARKTADREKATRIKLIQVDIENGKDQCCGLSAKKGKRCGTRNDGAKAARMWYCSAHQDQEHLLKSIDAEDSNDLQEEDILCDFPETGEQLSVPSVFHEHENACAERMITEDQWGQRNQRKICCHISPHGRCTNFEYCLSNEWRCWVHREDQQRSESESPPNLSTPSDKELNLTSANGPTAPAAVSTTVEVSFAIPCMQVVFAAAAAKSGDLPAVDEFTEAIEYVDVAAGGMVDPDEMDYVEEEPMNEEIQRLLEMTEIGNVETFDEDDLSSVGSIEENENENRIPPIGSTLEIESFSEALRSIADWSWAMDKEQRILTVARFMRFSSSLIDKLRHFSDAHVALARQDLAEAGADAFRSARIIGATVVGAARRLEAIRAAQPFAVIVEEACEVMEPTLMAVLAVKSLKKLEMIGDHRQLPAVVQQCWYSLETALPSIKVSMFERLCCGYSASPSLSRRPASRTMDACVAPNAPLTVLDEQRRMRRSIADITRPDYADIVQIVDHSSTLSQKIGDVALRELKSNKSAWQSLTHYRTVWAGKGNFVPGLTSDIYFWNLANNRQSRPTAGLSACNETEANAVAGLAKFLITCGVPPRSITVITPYKGQKNTIIKAIHNVRNVPIFSNRAGATSTGLFVSTVDRYQGDENDIVILSLVRTEPGNRFVALQNRFIVAASRARMGFFIIGSVDAVTISGRASGSAGPTHWQRFVNGLGGQKTELPGKGISPLKATVSPATWADVPSDTEDDILGAAADSEYSDDIQESAGRAAAISALFAEPTPAPEPKAQAAVAIHLGNQQPPGIGSLLRICCPMHTGSYLEVKDSLGFPSNDWSKLCSSPCSFSLPFCRHECNLKCHFSRIVEHNQQCQVPLSRPCSRHSDIPLICGELKNADAVKLSDAISRYRCDIPCEFQREECNHVEKIPCHLLDGIVAGTNKLPPCVTIVGDYIHPSCNHIFKAPRCCDRRKFEESPPLCTNKVQHTRTSCGCVSIMVCYKSIAEERTPSLCKSDINHVRPRCGHVLSLRCHQATDMTMLWSLSQQLSIYDFDDTGSVVKYGMAYGSVEPGAYPACSVKLAFERECGHRIAEVSCTLAFQYASGEKLPTACTDKTDICCPFCKTAIVVPCWIALKIEKWNGSTIFQKSDKELSVQINEDMLRTLDCNGLSVEIINFLSKSCQRNITVVRSCESRHLLSVPCRDILKIAMGQIFLPKCSQDFDRELPCKHHVTTKCFSRHAMPAPECAAVIDGSYTFACGIHSIDVKTCGALSKLRSSNPDCQEPTESYRYRCGHSTMAPCFLQEQIEAPAEFGEHFLKGADQVVVVCGEQYCLGSSCLNDCTHMVSYCYPCGHVRESVQCETAFMWAANFQFGTDENEHVISCEFPIDLLNPLCSHEMTAPCWVASAIQEWDPWDGEDNPMQPSVTRFDNVSREAILCAVVQQGSQRPLPPPSAVLSSHLVCRRPAIFKRQCGHESSVSCSVALTGDTSICRDLVQLDCQQCGQTNELICNDYQKRIRDGKPFQCKKIHSKACAICGINPCKAPCFKEVVECKSEVSAKLACGHQVRWKCGADIDPRTATSLECKLCLKALWDNRLAEVPEPQGLFGSFVDEVKRLMESCGDVLALKPFVESTLAENGTLRDFLKARQTALQKYLAMMNGGQLPFQHPPTLDCFTSDCYDITFKPKMKSKGVLLGMKPEDTLFGRGYLMRFVNHANLSRCKPDEDGQVVATICISLRLRSVEPGLPFVLTTNKVNNKRANQTAQRYQSQGFDSAQFFQTEQATKQRLVLDGEKEIAGCVYWTPGSVLPIADVTFRLHNPCIVCLDMFPLKEGYSCPDKHFICWCCLEAFTDSAMHNGTAHGSVDEKGDMICPYPGCKLPYLLQDVAGGPTELFQKLQKLKLVISSQKIVDEALAQKEEQHRLEMERIMKIQDADERAAELLRIDIIETILLLKCPRCKAAFTDFDGCFALTCHRCHCGFCAWCLADCGDDAHAHVAHCPETGGGDIFGTILDFEEHHRKRRRRLVHQKMLVLSAKVKAMALRKLDKDLKDLGIDIDSNV